jgi:hypothetical protein
VEIISTASGVVVVSFSARKWLENARCAAQTLLVDDDDVTGRARIFGAVWPAA